MFCGDGNEENISSTQKDMTVCETDNESTELPTHLYVCVAEDSSSITSLGTQTTTTTLSTTSTQISTTTSSKSTSN